MDMRIKVKFVCSNDYKYLFWVEEMCRPLPEAMFTAHWLSPSGCRRPGCWDQLITCEGGRGRSYIMLLKSESDILINRFLANFQKSIAKWSIHRHVADNGLTFIAWWFGPTLPRLLSIQTYFFINICTHFFYPGHISLLNVRQNCGINCVE